MGNETHTHDHAFEPVATNSELGQALDKEYQRNCDIVASASEDLHHQNLARMALLKENQGIEVPMGDLLNMKLELLLDELVGQDHLRRHLVGFHFQQTLAEHLNRLESGDPPPVQE